MTAGIYFTPGAASASKPQCNNRIDDDGDGKIDYPTDPGCTGKGDKSEVDPLQPPPPPPPPPGAGVAIDSFCDMGTPWGKNRWMAFVPSGTDEFFACNATSPPNTAWANGGGSFEVQTLHGPGFRLRATPDMQPRHCITEGTNCKRVDVFDYATGTPGHPGPIGTTDDYTGWIMFPAAQDPFPRNFCCWNVLFEFKATGQPGGARSGEYVPVGIGIDTTDVPFRNHLYVAQNYPSTRFRRALAPSAIDHDHWYEFRLTVRWSSGADGFVRFALDGVQIADWPGATIGPNDTDHRTQMTFYGPRAGVNEVVFAGLRLGS